MSDVSLELRAKQTGYDVATLFRVAPWIILMGDKRSPEALVKQALSDSRAFIEAHCADPSRDRRALMRGLLVNWCRSMSIDLDPRIVELIVGLVSQAVDEAVTSQIDPGLEGEIA